MNTLESALSGGSESGANLSRMVSVVINHADAGGLAAKLETAVYAGEAEILPEHSS